MEWPKLKNIILLILLVTNLFLLGLVGLREWDSAHYQAMARSDALEVLAKNNISMDKEALPRDVTLSAATVARDRTGEAALLSPLLGSVTEQSMGGGQMSYEGEKGHASLRSRGEFSVTLNPGACPLTGSLEQHAAQTLKQMGFDAQAVSVQGDGESGSVTLLQRWNGVAVLNCRVEALYEGGDLVSLTGSRLSGTPAAAGSVELSAVTGLLRFLEQLADTGDVCSQINRMEAGYQLSSGLSDPAVLTPVWMFETDTGSYVLDPASNLLTAV